MIGVKFVLFLLLQHAAFADQQSQQETLSRRNLQTSPEMKKAFDHTSENDNFHAHEPPIDIGKVLKEPIHCPAASSSRNLLVRQNSQWNRGTKELASKTQSLKIADFDCLQGDKVANQVTKKCGRIFKFVKVITTDAHRSQRDTNFPPRFFAKLIRHLARAVPTFVADRSEFHFDVAEAWPRFAEVGLKPLKMEVKEEQKATIDQPKLFWETLRHDTVKYTLDTVSLDAHEDESHQSYIIEIRAKAMDLKLVQMASLTIQKVGAAHLPLQVLKAEKAEKAENILKKNMDSESASADEEDRERSEEEEDREEEGEEEEEKESAEEMKKPAKKPSGRNGQKIHIKYPDSNSEGDVDESAEKMIKKKSGSKKAISPMKTKEAAAGGNAEGDENHNVKKVPKGKTTHDTPRKKASINAKDDVKKAVKKPVRKAVKKAMKKASDSGKTVGKSAKKTLPNSDEELTRTIPKRRAAAKNSVKFTVKEDKEGSKKFDPTKCEWDELKWRQNSRKVAIAQGMAKRQQTQLKKAKTKRTQSWQEIVNFPEPIIVRIPADHQQVDKKPLYIHQGHRLEIHRQIVGGLASPKMAHERLVGFEMKALWTVNGRRIGSSAAGDGHVKTIANLDKFMASKWANLMIADVRPQDGGEYILAVHNSHGSDCIGFRVQVIVPAPTKRMKPKRMSKKGA